MLTLERLKEVLDYCPDTGIFTRRKSIGRVRAGKVENNIGKYGYVRISIDDRWYVAHRLAWLYVTGKWPSEQIDHINGVRADNRICNLREASHQQNSWNTKKNSRNSSGKKGVTWHKTARKWQSHIKVCGRTIYLGLFEEVDDAHKAYCEAAKEHHGDFARFE